MNLLIGIVVIVAATWAGAPTLGPIVAGFMLGLVWPERAARTAALAALIAWAALLAWAWIQGTDVVALARSLGSAMGLPGWAPVVATLFYPVVLAASAAWIGQVITPRQFFWSSKANYRATRR